jgi:hypothetical protein
LATHSDLNEMVSTDIAKKKRHNFSHPLSPFNLPALFATVRPVSRYSRDNEVPSYYTAILSIMGLVDIALAK